jgi:hypothetical protein
VTLGKLTVGLLPTTCLTQRSKNYQRMSEAAFAALRASMADNGAASFILVAETKARGVFEVLDGHHRWQAAEAEGIAEVPVVLWTKRSTADQDEVGRDLAMLQFNVRAEVDAGAFVNRLHDLSLRMDKAALSLRTAVAPEFIASLTVQMPSAALLGADAQADASGAASPEPEKGPDRSRGGALMVMLPNTDDVRALLANARTVLAVATDADAVLALLRTVVSQPALAHNVTREGDSDTDDHDPDELEPDA